MFSKSNTSESDEETYIKEEGNRLFYIKQYEKAVECYDLAIMKNPKVPYFYTNRALCHLKLKQWDNVLADCRRSLDLDINHVKGFFFLGVALIEFGNYDEALIQLERAHNLTKREKVNYGDDITSHIRKAHKLKWDKLENARKSNERGLLPYLKKLLNDDMNRKIEDIKSTVTDDKEKIEELQNRIMEIKKKNEKFSSNLHSIFMKNDDKFKKREIPDFLFGRMGQSIFNDPVVAPTGITYNRTSLEDHLMRCGNFDPVTREPLSVRELIPNLALKEATETFIKENNWINDYFNI